LFHWEKGLVEERKLLLANVNLQNNIVDFWPWKIVFGGSY